MGVKTIDLNKSKMTLADLLKLVKRGKEILLVEGGQPLARLVPEKPARSKRIAGLDKGALIWMSEDFDDPMPEEFLLGEDT